MNRRCLARGGAPTRRAGPPAPTRSPRATRRQSRSRRRALVTVPGSGPERHVVPKEGVKIEGNSTPRGLVRRRHPVVRLALLTLGWMLIALGVVGGVLPALPGWPFGLLGAAILYVESRWFQRLVRRYRKRHPSLERIWKELRRFQRARAQRRREGAGGPASTGSGDRPEVRPAGSGPRPGPVTRGGMTGSGIE